MTLNKEQLQQTYDRNFDELQSFVNQINTTDEQMEELRNQLQQLSVQRNQLFVAAKSAEKVVIELSPFVVTRQNQATENQTTETEEQQPEVGIENKVKKPRK